MTLSAYAGHLTTTTAAAGNTVVVTGVGFQPKALIFYYSGRSGAADAVGRGSHFAGFGFVGGTTDRRATCFNSIDASAAADASRYQATDAVIVSCDNAGTLDGALDLQSFDSDGFTLVIDDAMPRDQRVGFLALGGADLTNVVTGTYVAPLATVTGNHSHTGMAFQPDCVLFMGSGRNVGTSSGATDQAPCLGIAVSSSQQAVWAGLSDDGSTTMDTESYCTDAECIGRGLIQGGSMDCRGTFVGMTSDGFTINWLEVGTSSMNYYFLALKGGSYHVGGLLTQTDTSTSITSAALGFQPRGGLVVSHCTTESAADTVQDHNRLSIGAYSSTSQRNAQALLDEHSVADSEVTTALEFDEVYANISTASAIQGLMDISAIGSNTVTYIMDDADPAQSFFFHLVVGDDPAGGTTFTQDASGTLTTAGAQVKQTSRALTGTVSSSGAIVRQGQKVAAGTLTTAGAIRRDSTHGLVGTLSSAGALAKQPQRALLSTLSSSAALVRQGQKVSSGTLGSAGAISRSTAHGLTGTLATAGVLTSVKAALLSLVATLTTVGAVSRQGQKASAGSLISSGGLTRSISRSFIGTLTSSGALASVRTILVSLTGTLTSGGAIARQTQKALDAALSGAGALSRAIGRSLDSILTMSGALVSSGGSVVIDLPYQGDAYRYDSGSGVGSVSSGTVQAGPNQASPIGSVSGGDVQPGPNQGSPTGSVTGGTLLPPETIL